MSSAARFEACIRDGGVAVFPSDTVYGLACDPANAHAVARLYELKRRPPDKAAAVMFFSLNAALRALPELGEPTRAALTELMPGAVTALLPNPSGRYPLASPGDPQTLGLRVVSIPVLAGAEAGVLQSSANHAGARDARRLAEVPDEILAGADLVLDGGELPGTPSTVIDLRRFESGGIDAVSVVRAGAVSEAEIAAALNGQFHFNPATYLEVIRAEVPQYDAFQEAVVNAGGSCAQHILELGTGTGETARRLIARHPRASLTGIDESEPMLARAREELRDGRVQLRRGRLQDPLPGGAFDLVASALCVHHLDRPEKADLFRRIREVLAPAGRFVLGDVVLPQDPAAGTTFLTPGYDKPSTAADQLRWLAAAGFDALPVWESGDLAVIVADRSG